MHLLLSAELKSRREYVLATPRSKVFPHVVTDVMRQKDFFRAGIAREQVVTDREVNPS